MSLRNLFHRVKVSLSAGAAAFKSGGVAYYSMVQVDHANLLAGKKILITGGGSGIGLALAKKCVALGATVIITGRNQEKLDRAIASMPNDRLFALNWDVSNVSIAEYKLKECQRLLGGGLDVLVNNAGVIDTASFLDVSEVSWDGVYATNSKGVFFLTQAICRMWKRDGFKVRKIINISSQGGYVGATYPYRMSKWDIAGLTQGLGLSLIEDGIIVNGIAPGVVATAMQPRIQNQKDNIYYRNNPVKRFALPEEVAELGVFLISDASNFIVGQTIVCDGGFSLK